MKVLVVDDEPSWRKDVSDVVKMDGHEVITAQSGRKAEKLLANIEFDVVITDVRMSNGNGIELCQFIWSWFTEKPPRVYVHSSEPEIYFSDREWNLEKDIEEFFGEFAIFKSKDMSWIDTLSEFLRSLKT